MPAVILHQLMEFPPMKIGGPIEALSTHGSSVPKNQHFRR